MCAPQISKKVNNNLLRAGFRIKVKLTTVSSKVSKTRAINLLCASSNISIKQINSLTTKSSYPVTRQATRGSR